jgi:hypothetical protein
MVLRSIGILASRSAYPKALKYTSLFFSKINADMPVTSPESTKPFKTASMRAFAALFYYSCIVFVVD